MAISLLLVDDDESVVCLLKIILEEEGFKVDFAYSGMAGVEKVTPRKYAVALLDYVLPDIKGDEVAEKIRLLDSEVGLILLTGYKLAIDPLKLGSFDYVLEKPAQPEDIIAAIRELVSVVLTRSASEMIATIEN